jgi:hypothetical protein
VGTNIGRVEERRLVAKTTSSGKGETVGIIPFIGKVVVSAFEFLAIWELRKVNRSRDAIAISRRNCRQGAQRSDAENLHE